MKYLLSYTYVHIIQTEVHIFAMFLGTIASVICNDGVII